MASLLIVVVVAAVVVVGAVKQVSAYVFVRFVVFVGCFIVAHTCKSTLARPACANRLVQGISPDRY